LAIITFYSIIILNISNSIKNDIINIYYLYIHIKFKKILYLVNAIINIIIEKIIVYVCIYTSNILIKFTYLQKNTQRGTSV